MQEIARYFGGSLHFTACRKDRELYVQCLDTETLAGALNRVSNKLRTRLSTRQREILEGVRDDLQNELAGRQMHLW